MAIDYDPLGRRTLLTLPNGVSTEYAYDSASRLTALIYRNALGPLGDLTYQYDANGNVQRQIKIGAEICGHTFVDRTLWVLRGKENKGVPGKSEEWRIARLDSHSNEPDVEDLGAVPFAARSLAFDGNTFWSNHRIANETISFLV